MSLLQVKKEFEFLTTTTWYSLDLAYTKNISIRETSVSDMMFLYLTQRGLSSIRTYATPHHLEKYIGTDWVWSIGSDKLGWLWFAIQAKKYNTLDKRYVSLSHPVNGREQYEILRDFTNSPSWQCIPLYALFNYVDINHEINYKINCKGKKDKNYYLNTTFPNRGYQWSDLGFTITPLSTVENILVHKNLTNNFFNIHTLVETISLPELIQITDYYLKFCHLKNSKRSLTDNVSNHYSEKVIDFFNNTIFGYTPIVHDNPAIDLNVKEFLLPKYGLKVDIGELYEPK